MNSRRWKRHAARTLLQDRWLHLTADRCELPSGLVLDPFYVLHEPEWVHIVASNSDQDTLVVEQYRYAADAVCLELPGGAVNGGETPLEAAGRELREETGFVAGQWSFVGWMYANPARQTNRIHIFLATELEQAGPQQLDASEEISLRFMSPRAIEQAIAAGEFSQALHIASFCRSRHLSPPAPGSGRRAI